MRIDNISRQNFGMFMIPDTPEMHKTVDQLDDSTLDKLNNLKKRLKNTNYYHLKVDPDLNFAIVCDKDTPWGGDGRILDYNRRAGNKIDMYWQTEYQSSLARTEDTFNYKNKDYIICEAKGKNGALLSSFKHIESLCWIIRRLENVAETEEWHQQERKELEADLFA